MRISVVDALNLSMLGIASVFALFSATPYAVPLWVVYPAMLALLLLSCRWHRRHGAMFVLPIAFLFAIFETFFMVVPYFSSWRSDDVLARMDLWLLGVNPTEWATGWAAPALTELLYWCYLFYFPMPLFVLVWMYRRSMLRELEEAFFVFLTCYYASYVLYFLFPAEGPRYHLMALHPEPLPGFAVTGPIRALIDALEPNKFDAFPSVHAAILLTTMLFAYRHHRRMFWWLLAPAVGIAASLVYCRYHYAVDVLVGFGLAGVNYGLGRAAYARIQGRFAPHFETAA